MAASGDVGTIGFDRSRVRILLCDKDPTTAHEVKDLLCRCSYQVSVVKTARQVVEVLNLSDSKVDIVLAEVELPNGKGLKMLKHLVKRDNLKHIPIVMMSAHDEMAIVVKCLRLGAADYLVKPLRVNELLNLWTHMWRRRRMLGLAEKHIVKGSLAKRNIISEIFVSDTSESNTISTDMFSEDSSDTKFMSKDSARNFPPDDQIEASPALELSLKPSSDEARSRFPQSTELIKLSPPLKIGQSSAFLSYARLHSRGDKVEATRESPSFRVPVDVPPRRNEISKAKEPDRVASQPERVEQKQEEASEAGEWRNQYHSAMNPRQADPRAVPVFNSLGVPHMMVTHSLHPLQPAGIHYYHPAAAAAEASGFHHPSPAAFSYYPFPIHVAAPHQWQALPSPAPPAAAAIERRTGSSERREAALSKFRQKRKDRCYEKKIRYASRKRLAEQRPRIKGQFVKRMGDYEEEEDEEEENAAAMSPESGVEITQ